MATLTGNPIVLSTADIGNTVVSNSIRVQGVNWFGGAIAAADTCVIKDKGDAEKIELGTSSADDNHPLFFPQPVIFNGLKLTALGNGKVHVYLAEDSPKPVA